MKKGSERQSAPPHNREATQRAVFLPETRHTKGRESCCPGSYSLSFVPHRRGALQQAGILLLELLQFRGRKKSQGIGNGQNLAVQNGEAAIPRAFFSAERFGQRQEHSYLRHLFNPVHQYRNGSTAQDQHGGWPGLRQMEMLVAADHIVGPGVALHDVANFLQHGTVQIHNRSAETVRAPNFLNRRRGNYEAIFRYRKHGDMFPPASVARHQTGTDRLRHRDPTGCICREMDSKYFSIAGYISSMPTT